MDSTSRPTETSPALHVVDPTRPLDWERIYNDHIVSIHRLMYSKVGNRPDAEDLTSQVFLTALPRLRAGASSGEIHQYLVATARTVLADHWRRTLGVAVTSINDDVDAAPVGPMPVSRDPRPRIQRMLGRLPQNYRRVLEMRFLEKCSVSEVAAELGITAGHVRVLQHRALHRAAALGQEVEA